MRAMPASSMRAMKGNQRQELMKTRVAKADHGVLKKPIGRWMMPAWISSGLIMPPEVLNSQRQMITTMTVGTIQVRMIQVRAMRTPGKRWLRTSAAASASAVWRMLLATTHATLMPRARQTAGSARSLR